MAINVIQQQIVKKINTDLKKIDFYNKTVNWNRCHADFIQVVNFQPASFKNGSGFWFTINLGVFSPHIYCLCQGLEAPRFVKETDCVIRTRIGPVIDNDFSGKAKDKWWKITNEDEINEISEEVINALMSKGIPFLDQFNSFQDIHDFLVSREGWRKEEILNLIYLMVTKAKLNDKPGAEAIFQEIKRRANEAWLLRTEKVLMALKEMKCFN